MGNPWIEVARVLIPLEGLAGMVFNAVLIFYLVRTNIGRAARLYYFSSIVTALLNFYTAIGIVITIDLPIMVDGNVIAIFYGPLLFYFPKWVNDAICVAFFSQLHTMWQMIPAPSILQWFALTRSHRGELSKLVVAYALPITLNVITWIQMPAWLPSVTYREEVSASVERLYGSNSSEFHVFAIPVLDKAKWDMVDLALFDVIPSYSVSYALFTLSTYKIRCKLNTLGTSISEKTKQMQRRFLHTQIAQVLLPLVVMSLPMSVLVAAAFLGRDLRNLPFLIAYMWWPMPMFTALLLLAFVRKSAVKTTSPNATSTISLSKNTNLHGKRSARIAPLQYF